MNTRTLLSSTLALAISTGLLAACGGGGSNGMLRADAPPNPPPSGAPAEPCPAPVTGDCTVTPSSGLTWTEGTEMTGGRQSDHALIVNGGGILHLRGDYRFSGGTTIEDGATLVVWDSLTSDVHVASPDPAKWGTEWPQLWLGSTLNGNVINDGTLSLQQLCGTGIDQCVETRHPVINGDYRQSATGQLQATFGWPLQINGSATIDGKLVLLGSGALNYVLPSAPASVLVLHANKGVMDQFADWASYSLFLTGSLRYQANDIYFDATAISVAPAMAAAKAGDAITLQSAAHFDAALGNAGTWANRRGASFSTTQRQFLASAGVIQRLQDYGQAIRTFDSMSGHGYADAAGSLLQQAALPAPELMARVGNLHAGSASGSWASRTAMLASGAGAFSGERAGFDQWLGDRTLLGSSFGWSEGSLRFDRSGGAARDQSPQWDVYVRRNGNGNAYVFGDVGYSRHQLDFNRRIDLGIRRQAAGARQSFDLVRAYVEAGRDFRVGQGRLTPFGAVNYAVLRGTGFTEQGNTGFELIAQPSMYQRFNGIAGLRLGTTWQGNGGRWTTLNLATGYRRLAYSRDNARAAFTGSPDVTFELIGTPPRRNSGWLQMSLATGGAHWNWLLSYDRQASDQALSLGAKLDF